VRSGVRIDIRSVRDQEPGNLDIILLELHERRGVR
jgi:hypothetical protein